MSKAELIRYAINCVHSCAVDGLINDELSFETLRLLYKLYTSATDERYIKIKELS